MRTYKRNWRDSPAYKHWQIAVLRRDGVRCVKCGSQENLLADHIKPADAYPELRFAIDNGRTLCVSCHSKIGNKAYRLFPDDEKAKRKELLRLLSMIERDNPSLVILFLSLLERGGVIFPTPLGDALLIMPWNIPISSVVKSINRLKLELNHYSLNNKQATVKELMERNGLLIRPERT